MKTANRRCFLGFPRLPASPKTSLDGANAAAERLTCRARSSSLPLRRAQGKDTQRELRSLQSGSGSHAYSSAANFANLSRHPLSPGKRATGANRPVVCPRRPLRQLTAGLQHCRSHADIAVIHGLALGCLASVYILRSRSSLVREAKLLSLPSARAACRWSLARPEKRGGASALRLVRWRTRY